MRIRSWAYILFLLIILSGIMCSISVAQPKINKSNITYIPTLAPVNATQTTLTFFVHSGSEEGPTIDGAKTQVMDGGSEMHYATTDNTGRANITGISGEWFVWVEAESHERYGWRMNSNIYSPHGDITIIMKKSKVTLNLLIKEVGSGASDSGGIKGARVEVKDGSLNKTEYYTDSDGRIEANGVSGYWHIYAEAFGYYPSEDDVFVVDDQVTHSLPMEKAKEVNSRPQSQEKDLQKSDTESKNDIIGKWKIQRDIRCDGHFSKDMMGIVTFHEDGTAEIDGLDIGYTWKQSGDTISWDPSQSSTTSGGVTENYMYNEGTVDGDTMSGTWTTHGSHPSNGCWKATRIE